MERAVSIDYETYFDKDYSIEDSGVYNYVHDPRFDAYLVAVHCDEFQWVGHPSKFDWNKIGDALLIAHNVAFDGAVTRRLIDDGKIPKYLLNNQWADTADLAVYFKAPRNLKGACEHLLKIDMKKTVRTKMKGKTYAMAVSAGMEDELLKYGGDDAKFCFMLWKEYGHKWPEKERRLSTLNREACQRGITINTEALQHALTGVGARKFPGWETPADFKGLEIQQHEALITLPWIKAGEPPLSPDALRAEARRVGITEVPASLAATSQDAIDWEDKWADKFPWVAGFRTYRRTNFLMKKFLSLKAGLRPDGVFPYQCKYFGGHLGRFSGGSGHKDEGNKFNIQNLPRKPMFGVDLRRLIIPPKGCKWVISDYAQIEARVLLWRVHDTGFMDMLRREGNLYQAYAKMKGVYKGTKLKKDDFDLYQHSKVEVLGCGYQCGADKYRKVAKTQYDIDYTEAEARAAVFGYRKTFPLVPEHWAWHQRQLGYSVAHRDPTHEIELASGRNLVYFNPAGEKAMASWGKEHFELSVQTVMGGPRKKMYGGKLTENEIQATARDIMVDGWLACDAAGFPVSFSVHDELALAVPESSNPVSSAKDIQYLMTHSSPWVEGCPLDTEAFILDYYMK
jgi:hypothetical protein